MPRKFGCVIQPAFGWIVDANQWFGNLAWSYRKGFDFNRAHQEKELSYFNIWKTVEDPLTPKELIIEPTKKDFPWFQCSRA